MDKIEAADKVVKMKEDLELQAFIKGKASIESGETGSDLHSITKGLSSFTDMANSLKSTIDEVDGMKQAGGMQPTQSIASTSSTTSSATGELEAQAKLNAKKAEELAS